MTAAIASAAGPGLPRTYDVARYDSPFPGATAQYPLQLANVGDLNGDGKEDFITGQLANTRNDAGQIVASGNGAIYIISGTTGERIKTIESPDPGGAGNRANFAFPWVSKVGTNRATAPFTDLGSCQNPPPNAGELCRSATVSGPDGVPDILVGARGVDARGLKDAGRVYVFDGATFALLKRIDQPASDTTAVALSRSGGTWFGRVVLNPSGLPPCAGNAGVGSCDSMPDAVVKGDVDAGGLPDLVISASATTEDAASAYPASHCARESAPGATCAAAGRVYVYRGENIVGSDPREILDGTVGGNVTGGTAENVTRIRNIHAQADTTNQTNADSEIFANSLIPIGDVGTCRTIPATATEPAVPPPPAGDVCPRDNGTITQDGKPDFVVGAPRVDHPVDAPDPALGDAGTAYIVDGATGTFLQIFRNPDPQLGATFGQMVSYFAPGDLGDTGLPDVLIPAAGHSLANGPSNAGRAYAMNGNFQTSVATVAFARLNDPTPKTAGRFGSASTGVGDLVPGADTPANEVLVGASSNSRVPGAAGDLHIFNVATERVLQTIADPDDQPGSSFGGDVIPLGDLNGDSFLDFAASAPLFDTPQFTDTGRVYVFRSDNSPAPAPPPPPPPAPPAPPPPAALPAPALAAPPPAADSDAVTARELRKGRCANDLVGTNDGESLIGTIAGDAIFARAGDDVVNALRGHDCVDAGKDDDKVSGSSGNDSLLGGADDDRLLGGSGSDRIFGQRGRDHLRGHSGLDMLAGGDGNDLLNGDSGRDRLYGERGNDRLYAGSGSLNLLDGGSGRDWIKAVNGQRDIVRCGSGRDRAIVDRIDRVFNCESVRRRRT